MREFLPESRFTRPTALCPNPHRWWSTDDDSTELQVSEMVAGLIRGLQPDYCVETGSAFGQTTETIGKALLKNGHGILHSLETDPGRVAQTRARIDGLPVTVFQMASLDFTPSAV